MKARAQPGQMELSFFAVPPAPRMETGGLDVALMVREMLVQVLAEAQARGHDRYEVAAQVSRLSARDVSKDMLDRYCAPSAEGWRFPLEALPALTQATGDYRLLELVAEKCGCRVARGEEAVLLELAALELHERATKARLAALKQSVPEAVMERLVGEVLARIGGGK